MTLDAPFDRLGAARGDPDRRVRLLHGTRPDRAVFELEELAFEAPHGLCPRGHDQVIGFLESSARLCGVDAVPDVFRRNAAHEPRDQPAVTEAVDHRVFFGDAHGVVAQRQNITEHADFYFLGLLAERRRDQIRRRHRAVGAVVVLVENDAVETQLFAIRHLFQMLGIVRRAFERIEETARHRRARRFFGHVGIGEKIEVIEFHESNSPSAKTSRDANTRISLGQIATGEIEDRRSKSHNPRYFIFDPRSRLGIYL